MSYKRLMQHIGQHVDQGLQKHEISRRRFMKLTGLTGLAIGFSPLITANAADPASTAPSLGVGQQPSEFLHIAPDGKVTIQVNRLEFGQGTHTGLARILAEELDADWENVNAELAKAGEAFKDPLFHIQMTGGSTGVPHGFPQYRELGARAKSMLISAAAKQWNVPETSIRATAGVLYGPDGKQAGFGEMSSAAMALPVPEKVRLKSPGEFKLIGHGMRRLDTAAKSTGQQMFGIDKSLPDMKTVLIARPPYFGGTLASVDSEAALKIKGVEQVMEVPLDLGATGVAVVADGYWPAKMGRDALKLRWNAPEKLADTDDISAQYTKLLDAPGLPALVAKQSSSSNADETIVADYHFPYLAHTPLEPLNAVIEITGSGENRQCQVWSGTQFQTIDQATIAAELGLKPEQVTLNTMFAGGGFGRRATPTSDYLADTARVMKAWMAANRSEPLKLVWSREDDVKGGYYRPLTMHRTKISLSKAGVITDWRHTVVSQSILKGTAFEQFLVKDGIDATATEGLTDTAYAIPISVDIHHPTQPVPVLWWRSVGHTHTAFVMETMIDRIAKQIGKDSVAYRRELLKDHPRHLATMDLAVEKSGYGARSLPEGQAWGVAIHESFGSVVMHIAEVSIERDQPVIHHVTSAVHCNTAVNPMSVETQIQGAVLMGIGTLLQGSDITITKGKVNQSNFHDYILARMPVMPSVDVHIVPSQEPPTGVGEPGLPPIAPAIANAVFSLTGKPVQSLPLKLS